MYSDLSPNELLELYLDGELPEVEHPSFFSQLSINERLQKELTMSLVMRNVIGKDIRTPPLSIEDELVGNLIPTVRQVQSSNPFLIRSIATVLLSALLSAIVTGTVVWSVWGNKMSAENISRVGGMNNTALHHDRYHDRSGAIISSKPTATVQDNSNTKGFNLPVSGVQRQSFPNSHFGQPRQDRSISKMLSSIQDEETKIDMNALDQSSSDSYSHSTVIKPVDVAITPTTRNDVPKIEGFRSADMSGVNSGDASENANVSDASSSSSAKTLSSERNIMTELRFFSMRSYPNSTLPGLINPPVNNFAITSLYSINPEHAVGIEVGQENIFQLYRVRNNNQEIVSVEQNYLAWWLSGVYRYIPLWARFSVVSPFAHISIGGTEIGASGRFILGADIAIFSSTSLMIGTESMTILSRFNGESIITSKTGISSGIAIRF
jgi:hypothetical protein